MIRIFIDNREADTDQHAAVSITLAVSSITKIETNRTGYCKTVRLPATVRNRSLLGDADRIHAPELFNQQPHTARIEADGFTVIEGSPRLVRYESEAGGGSYLLQIIGPGKQWVSLACENMFNEIDIPFEETISESMVRDSWTWEKPVRFFPVLRDTFRVSSGSIEPTVRMLTFTDYHPFLHVRTLVDAIAAAGGYTIRSDFMDGAPFRSLYMSGRYPEQQTEPFKERMGFLAGRFGDATASADRFGRVYADPLTAVSSVGNLVDTADPDRTQDSATVAGVYNRNDCFREDGQRIAYCPVEEVMAGFEYSLAYRTDYRIASREELKCFDRVLLDDDVERRFRVVNRHGDRRTVFHGGWQYRLIVFGHQPGTEYRFSYRRIANPAADTADLQPGDYETVRLKTFSQRSVLIDVPADEQATEASLEFLSNGTYIPYEGDWALYDGYVAETGQIDIRLTIRSAAREIAPSSPRYFDRVYFGGADQGMNLTLGRRTTLKPIFLPHPCEGSTVRFADVAAHRVRQIDLIGALKQMFNLCFYSDALTGTLYIEPRDDFYRDDTVIDWSDRIDRSRPVTVEELGADLSKLFTLRYQEGDGTVARWDERNKQILGRWSTPILNRFASEGERIYANPLFTPTLNRTGVYPDAPDASLAQVGDRDRTGVPADTENLNFPPKIVRFLGVRTLPDTQRWGWPGYGNEYPEIAFHDPSGDEPFTLCFEDRDGATGLHGGYDRSIEQYNSGRRITLYLRLNPEDIEPLISPNGLRRDFRALFKLAIEGETVMCRLEEISDYNPSAGSTRCVFLKET